MQHTTEIVGDFHIHMRYIYLLYAVNGTLLQPLKANMGTQWRIPLKARERQPNNGIGKAKGFNVQQSHLGRKLKKWSSADRQYIYEESQPLQMGPEVAIAQIHTKAIPMIALITTAGEKDPLFYYISTLYTTPITIRPHLSFHSFYICSKCVPLPSVGGVERRT